MSEKWFSPSAPAIPSSNLLQQRRNSGLPGTNILWLPAKQDEALTMVLLHYGQNMLLSSLFAPTQAKEEKWQKGKSRTKQEKVKLAENKSHQGEATSISPAKTMWEETRQEVAIS